MAKWFHRRRHLNIVNGHTTTTTDAGALVYYTPTFWLERFPLPLCAWDGLRYLIVALPEPSYNYFVNLKAQVS